MNLRPIAPITLAALMLSACANASTPGDGSPSPGTPRGGRPDDLLLRWGYEGGFTPPEFQLTNLPSFSLYGDGTVLRPGPQIAIYPGPALASIEMVKIDQTGIDAVLEAALGANLDVVGDLTDMGSVGIADAADTVFTMRFGEVDRTVRIYALSEMGGQMPAMTDDEFEARKKLLRLVEQLGSLETWLPEGSVTDAAPYEPAGARVFVTEFRGKPDLPQSTVEWPLSAALEGIGEDAGAGFRCIAVTGDEWTEQLLPVAQTANQLTPWTSEGRRYAIAFRPLLPGESGC